MLDSLNLLSVAAVVFFHVLFVLAILPHGRLVAFYLIILSLFLTLYFRRRLWHRNKRGGLYDSLGHTAVMLFASMVALFNGVDLTLRLGAAIVAGYFLYLVIICRIEEEGLFHGTGSIEDGGTVPDPAAGAGLDMV
jgi:O-antigen/teichoic acid export membrane protein